MASHQVLVRRFPESTTELTAEVRRRSLLAETAESDGDFDLAARRYLRMIEQDAFNEPAHLGLVTAVERSGRRGTSRRLYGNYVARMAELDVEPEPFPSGPPVQS